MHFGAGVVAPACIGVLGSESSYLRHVAFQLLLDIERAGISYLIEALEHDQWVVRGLASEALVSMGAWDKIPESALLKLLNDDEQPVRVGAVKACWLTSRSSTDVRDAIMSLRKTDDDELHRWVEAYLRDAGASG